jgi:hypothetical protein
MAVFMVRVFPAASGTGIGTPFIEIEADSLKDAEAKFYTRYVKDGRYSIPFRDTLYVLEREQVLHVAIEKK